MYNHLQTFFHIYIAKKYNALMHIWICGVLCKITQNSIYIIFLKIL